jgi:hypothetical protein
VLTTVSAKFYYAFIDRSAGNDQLACAPRRAQVVFWRGRHQPRSGPPAKIGPAPMMGLGVTTIEASEKPAPQLASRQPLTPANAAPHGSRCAERFGGVKAVAARSAGAKRRLNRSAISQRQDGLICLILGRLLYQEIGRLRALEDAIDVTGRASVLVGD